MIQIDHVGIAARNPESSAKWLSQILGAGTPSVDGADDDMFRIDLGHRSFVLFNAAEKIDLTHMAFRVDVDAFKGVIDRLRSMSVPFGNEPFDTKNGRTEDQLGGAGRVYFVDENGHLFEVTC
jgi:catechol 2,3-dioxygenase-like lactoylglutathione lyase family enzyme